MAAKDLNIKIGERIRALRERKGWTREYFAERLEKSASFVSDLEWGKSGPSNETLKALSIVLEVSTDTLLFGTGHRDDYSAITRHLKRLPQEKLEYMEQIVKDIVDAF